MNNVQPIDFRDAFKKAEDKRILCIGERKTKEMEPKYRNMVAHRLTKNGGSYGIMLRKATEREDPNAHERNNIEIEDYSFGRGEQKDDALGSLDGFSPVKPSSGDKFDFNDSEINEKKIRKLHSACGEEKSPTDQPGNNSLQNYSKNHIFREMTDKQEDSNQSMSRLSSVYDKPSKKHHENLDNIPLTLTDTHAIQTRAADRDRTSKSNSPKANKSLTRNTGYRTLKYIDLFHTAGNAQKEREEANDPSSNLIALDIGDGLGNKHMLDSRYFPSRSTSGSQMSIMVFENEGGSDINRNDYSTMDITVMGRGDSVKKKRNKSKMSKENHRQNSTKLPNESTIQQEDEEIRQNKDLNTTYIRSSEIINPKRSYKDTGMVITGKRTKINQYVLLTTIGKGGWGEVFLAVDVDSETKSKYVDRS